MRTCRIHKRRTVGERAARGFKPRSGSPLDHGQNGSSGLKRPRGLESHPPHQDAAVRDCGYGTLPVCV
jgi:hypothetical protein